MIKDRSYFYPKFVLYKMVQNGLLFIFVKLGVRVNSCNGLIHNTTLFELITTNEG